MCIHLIHGLFFRIGGLLKFQNPVYYLLLRDRENKSPRFLGNTPHSLGCKISAINATVVEHLSITYCKKIMYFYTTLYFERCGNSENIYVYIIFRRGKNRYIIGLSKLTVCLQLNSAVYKILYLKSIRFIMNSQTGKFAKMCLLCIGG